ncbi:hypothetical protein [Halomonas sp. RA08-2]
MELTLQIHFDQAGHDAVLLMLPNPDHGVRGNHGYAMRPLPLSLAATL